MGSKKTYKIVYTVLFAFIAVALLYFSSRYREGFQATAQTAPTALKMLCPLCFLCVAPPKEYLETLVPFTNTQPVYVLCDKNEYTAPESTKYKTIQNLLHIPLNPTFVSYLQGPAGGPA